MACLHVLQYDLLSRMLRHSGARRAGTHHLSGFDANRCALTRQVGKLVHATS
jgi:hypothetical protein